MTIKLFFFVMVMKSALLLAKADSYCGMAGGNEYYCQSGTSCCGIVNDVYQCCTWTWTSQWYIWLGVVVFVSFLSICLASWRRQRLRAMICQRAPARVEVTTTTVNRAPQTHNTRNLYPPSYGQANSMNPPPTFKPTQQSSEPPPYLDDNPNNVGSNFEPDVPLIK